MQDLQMEVVLFEKENPKYNHNASILAQFFDGLREKYPQIIIREYNEYSMEKLLKFVDLDNYDRNHPVFILNGHVITTKGIPSVADIEKYIEEIL